MSEDYLWDGSGKPDPELAYLENTLQRLRWSGRPPETQASRWYRNKFWLVAAAGILLVLGTALVVQHTMHPKSAWHLSRAGHTPSSVFTGQTIETGQTGASIEAALVGEVEIGPESRLRLLPANGHRHAMALDRGTIHALIWAPPTDFVVDTPAARTIDLGCQYTLTVAKDGQGFLKVELGWVAFQWKDVESFIPAGAACKTRVGHGPDTPYFLDAPKALTEALAEFDRTGNQQALASVLRTARRHDALTLWHLLERTRAQERVEVFNRFAELVTLPQAVTQERIERGDRNCMDAAWNALELGDSNWWRAWKRNW